MADVSISSDCPPVPPDGADKDGAGRCQQRSGGPRPIYFDGIALFAIVAGSIAFGFIVADAVNGFQHVPDRAPLSTPVPRTCWLEVTL